MKILVTSDNHLGFKETDPIRAEDSFATFDEILSIASREQVDFVLQGGDLFHENKPSRNTYNKTVRILREYCLGEKKPNFKTSIKMNTDDPNMDISLPILSIHGNHDDPSGFNSVSPLDILHGGGLINYFGKVEDVDDIELQPILIEGDVKIALYGMGHIKDRRVYKTFLKGKVRYKRPEGEDWISILVVHQNRIPRKEEYLPEDFIAPFFDLVIYGHEHESIKIRHRNFDVIQCGSTIRTSLCEGEAGDKYVYILDIPEKISIRRIKLDTVRNLSIDSIRISSGDPDAQVRRKLDDIWEKTGKPQNLPLLRLRVDLEGTLDLNKHRILSALENRIANPEDAIRISRKTVKEIEKEKMVQKNDIEELYKDILASCDLRAFLQSKVVESLTEFLDKDNKEAFSCLVKETVHKVVSNINTEDLVADAIEEAIKNARERLIKEDHSFLSNKDDESSEKLDSDVESPSIYDICKTVPLPQESGSFNNSSITISKGDFTFIEEKIENQREKEIVQNIKKEIEETMEEQESKRTKFEDDFADLLDFSKYI